MDFVTKIVIKYLNLFSVVFRVIIGETCSVQVILTIFYCECNIILFNMRVAIFLYTVALIFRYIQ